jgi:hypothetical protein
MVKAAKEECPDGKLSRASSTSLGSPVQKLPPVSIALKTLPVAALVMQFIAAMSGLQTAKKCGRSLPTLDKPKESCCYFLLNIICWIAFNIQFINIKKEK